MFLFHIMTKKGFIMARGIFWIVIGILQMITALLNKQTWEKQNKSSFGWGILFGLNLIMVLLWICKLTGVITTV